MFSAKIKTFQLSVLWVTDSVTLNVSTLQNVLFHRISSHLVISEQSSVLKTDNFFSTWQHICLARYMLSPVRLSVRPSICHTSVS